MKTRVFRIAWKDWLRLRKLIVGKKGETIAEYMNRVVNYIETSQDGFWWRMLRRGE